MLQVLAQTRIEFLGFSVVVVTLGLENNTSRLGRLMGLVEKRPIVNTIGSFLIYISLVLEISNVSILIWR